MRFRAILGPPAVLVLLYTALVWWPSNNAVSSATEALDDTRSEQLALFTEIDRLNETALRLSDIDRDLEDIASLIPSEKNIDSFLDSVATSAEASGVLINLISPTEVLDVSTADATRPVPPGIEAVAFILEAQGDFDQVMAFVDSFDDLSRLVVIDQLSMVAVDGETQMIVIDMSLRIFSGGVASQTTQLAEPLMDLGDTATGQTELDENS